MLIIYEKEPSLFANIEKKVSLKFDCKQLQVLVQKMIFIVAKLKLVSFMRVSFVECTKWFEGLFREVSSRRRKCRNRGPFPYKYQAKDSLSWFNFWILRYKKKTNHFRNGDWLLVIMSVWGNSKSENENYYA